MGDVTFLPPREARLATAAMDFSDRLRIAGLRAELTMCLLHVVTHTEALAFTGSDVDRRSAALAVDRAKSALGELSNMLAPQVEGFEHIGEAVGRAVETIAKNMGADQ